MRAHVQLAEMDPDAAEDHLARAFELSDRSRSSSLKDLLAELAKPDGDEAGGSTGAVVSAALRAWHGAGAVLARTVEQVGNAAPGAYTPDDIQRRVRAAERELDDAEAALAVAAPRLLANRPRLPATPALREIQQRLDVRTLLLQYHAFDDELIGWAVTRDSVRCRRRARETTLLTADVRRFHQMLVKPQSWADERDALARPLAALLLEPFTDELRAYQRVVVVSHGPLAVLPFHVLPFADDVLAATHTLSYLPSASMVPAEQALPRLGPDAQALVVGDLAYGAERGLSHLRCSSVEAFAVAQLHGTSALIPAAATRDAVLERLRTARLAHLATHGIFHERAPYSAEIALTGKASLTVPDLIRLGTSIDLAVLSACDTARGRATAVGDLIGPSRAFIAAGARELVVSLWPVDDRFVCLTMVAFHEQLTRGVPASLALARAQAQIRALSSVEAAHRWYRSLPYKARRRRSGEYRGSGTRSPSVEEQEPRVPEVPSHPFYWAPFIHIGTS